MLTAAVAARHLISGSIKGQPKRSFKDISVSMNNDIRVTYLTYAKNTLNRIAAFRPVLISQSYEHVVNH
jgi:hypothetical protein